MENINLREIAAYLLQKIQIVALIVAAVVVGGEIYTNVIKTPLYESYTNVVLISDSSSKTEITNNDITLSNNLVKTYSEIVKSRNVLNQVINNLNLDTSYEALKNRVSVSSVTSTQLISIKVLNEDNKKAKEIADNISKVFKAEVKSIYGIDNVQIVDEAVPQNSPANINFLKETAIYFIAGAALGVGIVYLMYILDRSIKDAETVESKLGLTVMGVVPEMEKK